MVESIAMVALVVSGLSALGSVISVVTAFFRKKDRAVAKIKLPDGKIIKLDSSMTEEQIREAIKTVSGKVREPKKSA